MKNIAIFGFGVVGGGIPDVIESCRDGIRAVVGDDINIKYILDLRDFPESPLGDRIVHDINTIIEDDEIELVAETMGGAHPAYEFSIAAMEHGKSVVTSNKEVVATFGDSLAECARRCGVKYLFEASVGGGIPVLRPFSTSLAHERIVSVSGILNGTTNFILSKMKSEGREFGDVLSEAQSLGYAERDPSADVDGIDAKRKIIILTALSTGHLVSDDSVYCESMRWITPAEIDAARRIGGSVKLIGTYRRDGEKMTIYVCPQIVMSSNPLSGVDDVYNAISVGCEITGDVMFYGRGAGRYPTAGAVVADIVAVLSGAAAAEKSQIFDRADGLVSPFGNVKFKYYIRLSGVSATDAEETLGGLFDEVSRVVGSPEGVAEFICGTQSLDELEKIKPSLGNVEAVLRILE